MKTIQNSTQGSIPGQAKPINPTDRPEILEAFKRQKKFDVVYADPPWDINQKGNYGAIKHYNLMTLSAIKKMPVAELCKENAALFLWVTNGLLQEGLDVMRAWGFTYRGYFIWGKLHMGLGHYFRNATEILFLGTRGTMPVDFHGQQNFNVLPRQDHSHKPEEMYAIIERLYQNRDCLELFARKRPTNPNWYIWGDEAEGGSDIVIPDYPVPAYSGRVNLNPTDPVSPDQAKED